MLEIKTVIGIKNAFRELISRLYTMWKEFLNLKIYEEKQQKMKSKENKK